MTDDELKKHFGAMHQEIVAMRQETADRFDAVNQENAAMHQETTGRFDAVHQEIAVMRQETADRFDAVHQENAAMRQETTGHFDAVHQEIAVMRQENVAAHVETRRHVDVVVERMETRFELLAETVELVNEKLDSKVLALDKKIDQTAAETQALIKFSHDELHRRVLIIEGKQQ